MGGTDPPQPLAGEQEPGISPHVNGLNAYLTGPMLLHLTLSVTGTVTELETDIRKWINEWNKAPRPFVWTEIADEILETLAAYCERIIGSEH